MPMTRSGANATRITLVALAIAAMLALVLASAATSSAQDGLGCPDGFVPASDGNGCVSAPEGAFNDNVTTSTSCVQGVLSDDGSQCIVPRLDAAPTAPATDATAPAAAATSAGVAVPAQAFTG